MSYLQSVTDSLCGHKLQLCAVERKSQEAVTEAEQLRRVWEMLDVLNPPEPDDVLMERIYCNVLAAAATEGIDDDELDRVVGAGRPPEIEPDDSTKDT
jgi:hypothetical protein